MRVLRRTMMRRGPDGEGEYVCQDIALGMRRLAIIDLATGDQPSWAADGQVVAFQNGETYNYRELRRLLIAKGCRFISQSDTEVLAHGYSVWGLDSLLDRLDGMFAVAILDRRSNELPPRARPHGREAALHRTCARMVRICIVVGSVGRVAVG